MHGEALRRRALARIQQKRQLLRKSAIFNTETQSAAAASDDKIDLTKDAGSTAEAEQDLATDLDLLEANLDPRDLRSIKRRDELQA